MRLLRRDSRGEISLTNDLSDNIPDYIALSHTWGNEDDEVTLKDITEGSAKHKPGYAKIQFCAEQSKRDSLEYFWVDTCCIDKSNYTELSEAINSMFRWYRQASKCYVYLSDLSAENYIIGSHSIDWKPAFREAFHNCKWFTRGWTLQELIAPPSVEFFSKECTRIGSRASLVQEIHQITNIPIEALQGEKTNLSSFSIEERLSWKEHRKTKREEDEAYCLLGIFNVHMPLIYGERRENAIIRLKEEIDKHSRTGVHSGTSSWASNQIYTALPVGLFRWIKELVIGTRSVRTPNTDQITENNRLSRQPMNIDQAGSEFRSRVTISGGVMQQGNTINL